VMETGAHGIAVIGAVALDPDPQRATRALREALDAWLEARRGRGAGA
jgi:thiamine monophosphate synthase